MPSFSIVFAKLDSIDKDYSEKLVTLQLFTLEESHEAE